jgi:quercetin dioxygenase-like cupin family protein
MERTCFGRLGVTVSLGTQGNRPFPGKTTPRKCQFSPGRSATRAVRTLLALGMVVSAIGCSTGAEEPSGPPSPSATHSQPPAEALSPLFEQALPNMEGKTFTSAIVDFPPAARAVPHSHGGAFVYAYVLEGTVRSRLAGEPTRTYREGENWVEQPGADHLLTENVSSTDPAKLLVIFISTTGAELKIDDPSPTPQ